MGRVTARQAAGRGGPRGRLAGAPGPGLKRFRGSGASKTAGFEASGAPVPGLKWFWRAPPAGAEARARRAPRRRQPLRRPRGQRNGMCVKICAAAGAEERPRRGGRSLRRSGSDSGPCGRPPARCTLGEGGAIQSESNHGIRSRGARSVMEGRFSQNPISASGHGIRSR